MNRLIPTHSAGSIFPLQARPCSRIGRGHHRTLFQTAAPKLRFGHEPKITFTPTGLLLQFPRTTYRVDRWPDFRVLSRAQSEDLKPASPLIDKAIFAVLHELRLSERPSHRLAVYDLLRDLPLGMHARLMPLNDHYWLGIHWLVRLPELAGLLESSPALFAAVLQHLAVGAIRDEQGRELSEKLRGRQRDLLHWLGLGTAEAHCKILRKFSRYAFSYPQWRTLGRAIAQSDVTRVLSPAPVIPSGALRFLSDDRLPWVLTPSAQAEGVTHLIKRGDCFDAASHDIDELLTFGVICRRFGIICAPISSFPELHRLGRHRQMLLADLPLAVGPLTDLPGVTPIATARDLIAEGETMRHCVGTMSYLVAGLMGKMCFYRVHHPVRATVSLVTQFGQWTLDQIRGPRNEAIPPESLHQITRSFALPI